MRFRAFVITVFAALPWGASPGWADDASSKIVAAKRILQGLHVAEAVDRMLPTIIQESQQKVITEIPAYKDKIIAIMPRMERKFHNKLGEFTGIAANIYARHFSADELHDISQFVRGPRTVADKDKFLQSPAGMKFKSEQPAIRSELSEAGTQWGSKLGQDVAREMKNELAAR